MEKKMDYASPKLELDSFTIGYILKEDWIMNLKFKFGCDKIYSIRALVDMEL